VITRSRRTRAIIAAFVPLLAATISFGWVQ